MNIGKDDRLSLVFSAVWLAIVAAAALGDPDGAQIFLFTGVAPVAALLGWRWIKAAKE